MRNNSTKSSMPPPELPELRVVINEETRRCRKCKKVKPVLTAFNYTTNKYGVKKIAFSCRVCGGPAPGNGYEQPRPKVKAPKFKEGYEPGSVGWLIEDLIKHATQMSVCKSMAVKQAKGTTDFKRYWMGFFKARGLVEETRVKIIKLFRE